MCVHIISEKAVRMACLRFPKAAASLQRWVQIARSARWKNIADVRLSFPDADPVMVESKKIVTVFNIRRNEFRLIAAIHYDRGRLFVLRILTHAEYSKDMWKDQL
jgi:mRNA interferase HigB